MQVVLAIVVLVAIVVAVAWRVVLGEQHDAAFVVEISGVPKGRSSACAT